MARYLRKEEVKQIIQNRPQGTTPEGIVAALRQQGNILEGYSENQQQVQTLRQQTGAAANPSEVRRNIGQAMGMTELEQASREANRPLIAARTSDNPLQAGGKAIANVPSSAINLVRNVATAVFNPIDTVKGLYKIGAGGIQKLVPGEQVDEAAFDEFVNVLGQRYGSLDALQLTATNDPFGFGADVVGGVTAAGKGLLRGATREAAEGAAQTAATRATQVVTTPVTSVVRGTKNRVGQLAVSRMDKALQLNPTDKRRIMAPTVLNGKSPSEWLVERGIAGNRDQILEQLTDISTQSKKRKDAALARISNTYRLSDDTLPTLDYDTRSPRNAQAVNSAREALELLKKEYKGIPGNEQLVGQIDELLGQRELSLTQLEAVKSLIDRNLDIFKTTGDVRAGATAKGLANIRRDLKTFIENEAARFGEKDIAKLNKETQAATEIRKAIIKKEAALENNRALSLTDLIVGVGVGAGVDFGTGAGVVIAKKVLESPRFQTNLARQLNKLSSTELTTLERAFALGAPSPEYIAIIQRVLEGALEATQVGTPETLQPDLPVGAVPINAEDEAPVGYDVERIGGQLYAIPREQSFNGLRNIPSY